MGIARLEGKVAVVTGASSGIGAAIAVALVKRGLTVVGVARRQEKVEALQERLNGETGKLFSRKCDVSKHDQIENLFNWVAETFGTLHVLINNAGIFRLGRLCDQSPKLLQEVLDTNVMGLAVCTQQALKVMKQSGVDDGHIIHINSILGHYVPMTSTPLRGMYPPSKFAVTAMTESLRQELISLNSKIRVTSISPGLVRTEMSSGGTEEKVSGIADSPRLEPEDIAESVLYVLSTPARVQIHEITIKPVGEVM